MNIKKLLQKNSLLKDFLNYFTGRILAKGVVFISIPIFSRILDPTEFGVVSVFVSLFLIISILIQLNVSGSIRQYILKSNKHTGSYIFNQVLFFLLFFLILELPIIILFKDNISSYFEIDIEIYYLLIIGSFANVFISFYEFYLLGVNKSKEFSIFSFVRAVFEIVVSIIFVIILFTNKDIGRISGIVLTYSLFALYSFYRIIKLIKNYTFDPKYIKYALAFGAPLIIHQLSSVVLAQADKVIISKILDFEYVGLYSMAYSLGSVMMIVVTAFNSAWLPKFYTLMKSNDYKTIHKTLITNLKLLIVLSVLVSIVFNYIIPIIISKEYADSFSLVPTIIMSAVFIFIYLMYANFSFYQNKTLYISIGTVLAAIVNISLNYLLIPIYGYKVAALTTVISYLSMVILHYLISSKLLHSNLVRVGLVTKFVLPYTLWVIVYYCFSIGYFNYSFLFELFTVLILIWILYKSNKK